MKKYRISLVVSIGLFIFSSAYAQENSENHQIKNITGSVISIDSVGNIISIRTNDQRQMAFFIPDKAIITQETQNIGLMDIGKSDTVKIQYYLSSSKYYVVSIMDNEPVINE